MGYERVWSCPDIDMIYAPAKYGAPRSFEGASGYLLTVDSLDLHGKLVFHEVDHTTHVARDTVENGRKIPGGNTKLPNAFASRQVLRRDFALTRAKRTALWWFDFLGGNYDSPEMMAMVAELVRVQNRPRDLPMRSAAEIAVFGDVPSMYHSNARSSVADDLLARLPDELARIGAPYDIYNFSDLDHRDLPWDRYKLCIFLNAFWVPDERRAFIRSKVQRNGRILLWFYAPNYIQKNGDTVASRTRILESPYNELPQLRSAVGASFPDGQASAHGGPASHNELPRDNLMKRSLMMMLLASVSPLLLAAASGGDAAEPTSAGHTVKLDSQGKIIPWSTPAEKAYSEFLHRRWNFIKTKVPPSPGPAPRSDYRQYYFYDGYVTKEAKITPDNYCRNA